MPNRHELLESGSLTPAIEWFSEQIPGGFFIYRADNSMEILYINNAVLNIFGCETIEEFKKLTGYTFKGLVHPEDFEATQRSIDMQISRSNNNEKNDYAEYRIIRKDGNIRWIEDYGHFAQLPGYGDVFYVFIGDITEKHLAEEENTRRATVYSGLKEQYRKDAKNSLSAMRINLTKDMIEASGGTDPYPVDVVGKTRKDSISARLENLPVEGDREKFLECFETEKLLELFYQGKPAASFVAYCKRASGKQCFVRFSRAVALNPSTGDLILFGSDDEYLSDEVLHDMATQCRDTFFLGEMIPSYDEQDIIHVLQYYAQKESAPEFYTFDAINRGKLDVAAIARQIFDEDMGPRKKAEYVNDLWDRSDDNMLRLFFGRKQYFWKQLDIELMKLSGVGIGGGETNVTYGKKKLGEMALSEIARYNPAYEKELRDGAFAAAKDEEGYYTCAACGRRDKSRIPFQVDHIVPMNRGGKSVPENLQILCRSCNGRKGDR